MAITEPPKVSVVMTTYNGEKWITEQLHSILSQITPQDEVIICDDGSTDATQSLIEHLADSRIQLFVNTERLGPWKNSIKAISLAHNDIIMVSDQDDIWNPQKYALTLKALSPSTELILHDATIIDSHSTLIAPSYFGYRKVHHGVISNILKNSYTGCCMVFRRSLLEYTRPFPPSIPYDQWLGICSEIRHTTTFLPTPLLQWRRHSSNVTNPLLVPSSHFSTRIYQLRYRLYLTLQTLKKRVQKST